MSESRRYYEQACAWAECARGWRKSLELEVSYQPRPRQLRIYAFAWGRAVQWCVDDARKFREAWEAEQWDRVAKEERANIKREEQASGIGW